MRSSARDQNVFFLLTSSLEFEKLKSNFLSLLGKTYGGSSELPTCKGEDIGYNADMTYDDDYNKIISCKNEPGSCRKNICECGILIGL